VPVDDSKSENQRIYVRKDDSASETSDDTYESKLTIELGIVLCSLYHTFLQTGPSCLFRCIEERTILFGWWQLQGDTFTGAVILP
jgi:hypothetical protein